VLRAHDAQPILAPLMPTVTPKPSRISRISRWAGVAGERRAAGAVGAGAVRDVIARLRATNDK